jgi:large subunit ribosomal protein L18
MKKIFTFDKNLRKKRRISLKIFGKSDCPRISVFRSNKYIYTQAIDDEKKVTIASFSGLQLKKTNPSKMKKTEEAKLVGLELAKILKEKKINHAVFDRGRYQYHGRVAALCEGLREGGIKI